MTTDLNAITDRIRALLLNGNSLSCEGLKEAYDALREAAQEIERLKGNVAVLVVQRLEAELARLREKELTEEERQMVVDYAESTTKFSSKKRDIDCAESILAKLKEIS